MQDSKRDTDVQNSLLDSVGDREGRMIWDNGIETCIISYMKPKQKIKIVLIHTHKHTNLISLKSPKPSYK